MPPTLLSNLTFLTFSSYLYTIVTNVKSLSNLQVPYYFYSRQKRRDPGEHRGGGLRLFWALKPAGWRFEFVASSGRVQRSPKIDITNEALCMPSRECVAEGHSRALSAPKGIRDYSLDNVNAGAVQDARVVPLLLAWMPPFFPCTWPQDQRPPTGPIGRARAPSRPHTPRLRPDNAKIAAAQAEIQRLQTRLNDRDLKAPARARVLYKVAEPGEDQ